MIYYESLTTINNKRKGFSLNKLFQFGQNIPEYDFKVINERDARASAGIMFLLGTISFFSVILTHNLFWAELFSITFIIEFLARMLINPIYAPYMILGSLIVSNQQPEWVEAKPKRFAWMLGAILGLAMSYYVVFDIVTPARAGLCILCLTLLFLESSFGICLGCIVYKRLNIKLYKCPGGSCEVAKKTGNIKYKLLFVAIFALLFYATYHYLKEYKYTQTEEAASIHKEVHHEENSTVLNKDCTPPKWAVDMGHKEMWLEHHGCK